MPPPIHSVATSTARATAAQFVKKRDEDARAGCADGMAEGDGAAVHVHARGVPAELAADGAALRGERFVGLDEVDVVERPARLG